MKNIIFTSSDAKYGDFLINHWLPSLRDNVNLRNTDVVVLDYGLTKEQMSKLGDVIVYSAVRDGHVTSIRYRDMYKFLKNKRYDQVLAIDSGDIIFQDEIRQVWEENKTEFRAVCEEFPSPFDFLFSKYLAKETPSSIKDMFRDKRMINAGVIFAPYGKFKKLCKECHDIIIDKTKFGPDQLAVNYLLYRDGFKQLEEKYNFVVSITKNRFFIKDGIFYLSNKEKIAIVHNAGNNSLMRPIRNFGYGINCNRVKKITIFAFKKIYLFLRILLEKGYLK